jgi:uncharacterized membrane protein YphA (DoxX/SURF4 family)
MLRGGVAFAFLYPPLNALADPDSWIGYFPGFVHGFVPDLMLLQAFGLVEIIIALWILSGWKVFWPALAAAFILVVIVACNVPQFQIVFRDLSIAAMSVALALIERGSVYNYQVKKQL